MTKMYGPTLSLSSSSFECHRLVLSNSVCWSHALVNGPTSKRPASDGDRCHSYEGLGVSNFQNKCYVTLEWLPSGCIAYDVTTWLKSETASNA